VLPDRPGSGENHREQGDAMIEIMCEATVVSNGAKGVACGEPATHTLRWLGKVFHLCRRHYEVSKDARDKQND